MIKVKNAQLISPAAQLMAIEIFSELLASTSPHKLSEVLTEHLRELSGAKTVLVIAHQPEPALDELLTVSPLRRATLFSPIELNNFCHERTPEELPLFPEELSLHHPLRAPLLRTGIRSIVRYPLRVAGELIGILLLFDIPEPERIAETNQIINLLAPPIALTLKNALAFRLIEQQTLELEQHVEERTAELRETQALLQIAIDRSPLPIMIHDEDDHVLQLSNSWTNLSGYSLEDIPTVSDWMERAYGERSGTKKDYIDKLFDIDQTVHTGELTITAKNGTQRIWDFQTTPLGKVSKGKRVLLSMAYDITERKRDEEERAKLESQLQQARKMESVGHLAGGVAHDFNNMLGVILGHAELALLKSDPSQPLFANLEEIRKSAERSADLTRQLLAFARKQTVAPQVLDLNMTVAGILKMLQRLIGENIDLKWQPGADLWPIRMDPSQIDQILANLCVNARDAISGVGKMTIETGNIAIDDAYCAHHGEFATGEYVRLAVSDNGRGIDKETLPHIFEPFYTTKETGKGTGLGLATVYGIVKQNSGFINVYSEPDHGTTFTIYLPRHEGEAGQSLTEYVSKPGIRGQETILLVEDEPVVLSLTTMMLEMLGYTVLAANSPDEALHLAGEHPREIHLLLTDVVMPKMNGRDLANNLLCLCPHLKRLFMSGYTANIIAHHGVLDEGMHFIQKPFSIHDLAAKVREALDST